MMSCQLAEIGIRMDRFCFWLNWWWAVASISLVTCSYNSNQPGSGRGHHLVGRSFIGHDERATLIDDGIVGLRSPRADGRFQSGDRTFVLVGQQQQWHRQQRRRSGADQQRQTTGRQQQRHPPSARDIGRATDYTSHRPAAAATAAATTTTAAAAAVFATSRSFVFGRTWIVGRYVNLRFSFSRASRLSSHRRPSRLVSVLFRFLFSLLCSFCWCRLLLFEAEQREFFDAYPSFSLRRRRRCGWRSKKKKKGTNGGNEHRDGRCNFLMEPRSLDGGGWPETG